MASVPQSKVCTKCKRELPPADYYVKCKKTGRRYSWCKGCHSGLTNRKYHEDPEHRAWRNGEYARQKYAENPEARRKASRRYAAKNREKVNAAAREHRQKSKDKIAAYRAANAEKIKAQAAEYRGRKREELRQKNNAYYAARRDEIRERARAWRAANPEKDREYNARSRKKNRARANADWHRRRAWLAGNGGLHSPAEWEEVKQSQGYACAVCGRCEPEIKLTKDHVVPVSKGGTDDIGNIQGLCQSCNSRKRNQLPEGVTDG